MKQMQQPCAPHVRECAAVLAKHTASRNWYAEVRKTIERVRVSLCRVPITDSIRRSPPVNTAMNLQLVSLTILSAECSQTITCATSLGYHWMVQSSMQRYSHSAVHAGVRPLHAADAYCSLHPWEPPCQIYLCLTPATYLQRNRPEFHPAATRNPKHMSADTGIGEDKAPRRPAAAPTDVTCPSKLQ